MARLVGFVITEQRFLRLRLVPIRCEASSEDALPEVVRALFQRGADELRALGFQPESIVLQHGPASNVTPSPTLWLRHESGQVWASLGPAQDASPGALLQLALVSYFTDDSSLASLSGEACALWARAPEERVLDRHRVHWSEQVSDHFEALASDVLRRPRMVELGEVLRLTETSFVSELGQAVPLRVRDGQSPQYGLPWTKACLLTVRGLFPSRARADSWPQSACACRPGNPKPPVRCPGRKPTHFDG